MRAEGVPSRCHVESQARLARQRRPGGTPMLTVLWEESPVFREGTPGEDPGTLLSGTRRPPLGGPRRQPPAAGVLTSAAAGEMNAAGVNDRRAGPQAGEPPGRGPGPSPPHGSASAGTSRTAVTPQHRSAGGGLPWRSSSSSQPGTVGPSGRPAGSLRGCERPACQVALRIPAAG
jgi:hypothetical protein